MASTTVVNLKTGARYDVYIGRPSIFGNPFSHWNGDGTRAEVIAKFERHAIERCLTDVRFAKEVKALYGKVLGCYCKPLACHGDILIKLTTELNK